MDRKFRLQWVVLLLTAMLVVMLVTACDDDKPTNTPDDFGIVSGVVYGAGRAVLPDVTVSIGDISTTTNSNGEFILRNVEPCDQARVNFSKAGLIGNQKVVEVAKGRTTYTSSTLFLPVTQTFASTAGASITDGWATVDVPVDAFADAAGNPFTGNVLVEFKYFDPTQPGSIDAFPGNFYGTQTDGTETMFESYGFISASFFQASNPTVELNLADGKTAQLTSAIPYALQGNAPETIPMWYYDEDEGKWMEQGTATKVGTNYVGSVSHFTYWNFDHPINPDTQSTLTGRVMTADRGEPIEGAQVVATGVNYSGYTRAFSQEDGTFSITVKASATCTLQAFAGLNNSPLSAVIDTPAAGGTYAYGDLTVADLSFTLTGTLQDTDGDPVTMGYGMLYQVNPPSGTIPLQAWLSTNADGVFSATVSNTGSSNSVTAQVMFTQRGTLYSSTFTIQMPSLGSVLDLGEITMRPGGEIKGRVRISGGAYLSGGNVSFHQEGATGEGSFYSSQIDEDGYFTITGPPSTSLENMRGSVYVDGTQYQTELMTLSFPGSGRTTDIGTVSVTIVR